MSERQTVLLRATKLGSRWLLEAHHLQTHAEHRFKSVAALEVWLRQTLPEEEQTTMSSPEDERENT
jgi:hypothetical protein